MEWGIFWTIIGSAIGIVGIIYQFIRNFKLDIKNERQKSDEKIMQLDNRIFQLAMGRSLKEIMLEEREKNNV